MVFTSTSEVYGDPDKFHTYQNEEYWGNVNPMGIRSCYDEGKRCAEAMCFSAHRQHNVQIKVARLFNSYGPGMRPDDGRVISNFIMQALKNEPITIYGSGKQTRSYCYVMDTVRGLISLMEHPCHTNRDGKLTAINFGNNKECYSVKEVALKIKAMTESKSNIVYKDLPEDDPHTRRPALGSALAYCNWQPEVDFDRGLYETIQYFKQFV
jgi:UDP-glucuronate decarboxylase